MRELTYPFKVQPLPYEYDELLPVIDVQTMKFHHDKHYKTYVDNLNNLLKDYPELQGMTVKELLASIEKIPMEVRAGIRNNGGGVYNHELYFDSMRSPAGQMPTGTLKDAIERDFGSLQQWKDQMHQAAVTKFGSGWAWLLFDKNGNLVIVQTANQDVPDMTVYTPLLLVDVWEHAYYLQYQNRRADYVEGWFNLINWDKVQKRYEEAQL